jgi:NAD(P)-dependent dehydrogenase (short-subunit alcohol dehydrogenase family)
LSIVKIYLGHHTSEIADVKKIAQRDTAIGRIADPNDVAECVVWLCSAAASYITCTLYDVSGGR